VTSAAVHGPGVAGGRSAVGAKPVSVCGLHVAVPASPDAPEPELDAPLASELECDPEWCECDPEPDPELDSELPPSTIMELDAPLEFVSLDAALDWPLELVGLDDCAMDWPLELVGADDPLLECVLLLLLPALLLPPPPPVHTEPDPVQVSFTEAPSVEE